MKNKTNFCKCNKCYGWHNLICNKCKLEVNLGQKESVTKDKCLVCGDRLSVYQTAETYALYCKNKFCSRYKLLTFD